MTKSQDKALFNQNKRLLKSQLPPNPVCPYCCAVMLKDDSSPYALVSIDHVTAYSKGGTDELENLIACCANCNTKKGNNPHAVMFRLSSSRVLKNQEYENLNDFITVSVRIGILENLKEMVLIPDLPGALELIKSSQLNTTSKNFFSKLEGSLENCLKIPEAKKREDYLIKEIIVRLKAEKDKMSEIKELTSYIKFSTYCLL